MCLKSLTSLVIKKKGSVSPVKYYVNDTKNDRSFHSRSLKLRVFDGIFILFGALVLSAHLNAIKSLKQRVEGCSTRLFPWLVSDERPVCVIFEVNCDRNSGIKNGGDAIEIDQAIQNVSTEFITHFGIRHCEDLSIPPSIQDLESLFCFEIYNSTLHNWPKEAALTKDHHKQLTSLLLIEVNLIKPGIPDGMLHQPALDVEIFRMNLDFLPDDLGEYWTQDIYTLYLEHCGFQSFPLALNGLSLSGYVSLGSNNFTEIPGNALARMSINELSFSRNPIQNVPVSVTNSLMAKLFLDETNITTLPDWADEKLFETTSIYAVNTPLCEKLLKAAEDSGTSIQEGIVCDEIVHYNFEMFAMPIYEKLKSEESQGL
jgi:hypothetical protein